MLSKLCQLHKLLSIDIQYMHLSHAELVQIYPKININIMMLIMLITNYSDNYLAILKSLIK